MNILKTFFGQVIRKNDVDFIGQGARDAIVQSHIDFTSKLGGVINGLNVFKSIDGLSILITPGTFYSTGDFSSKNNLGGGERARVFTTQSFTGLPATAPIGNQASYLVVYAKLANTNSNPDPTKVQTVVSSKNIQTGENVLTREYPTGAIVVSNPVLISEINKFNGVPLAILQVDYSGTSQVSSNGTVQSIDSTAKRNYIVGGSIDIANQEVIASAIPDGLITTRMIGAQQITGDKFLSGSINSQAIADYDGSLNITSTGNGIATGHLKDGAVTSEKMNYSGSLDGFSARNHLINSSFEASAISLSDWTYVGDIGTVASVETNTTTTLFGLRSAKLQGAASVGVPKSINISQVVDFGGPINGQPITAFLYARPLSDFNLAEVGTNGINGVLEFFNNLSDTTPVSGITFASYSGVSTGEFIKLQTSGPIVIPKTTPSISVVKFSISGVFSNTVNVDGAFLGLTDISPSFDISIDEQAGGSLDATRITTGQMEGERLVDGAIVTRTVRNANGGVNLDVGGSGFGIAGSQIKSATITAANIAPGTITNTQLSAGIAAIPVGAILMFVTRDTAAGNDNGCPSGFEYLPDFEGRLVIGANPNAGAGSTLINPGNGIGTKAVGNGTTTPPIGTTSSVSVSPLSSVGDVPAGGNRTLSNGDTPKIHSHVVTVPMTTVIFCKKKP